MKTKHQSLQAQLQSRIARRANAITALTYLESWYRCEQYFSAAEAYKVQLTALTADQVLDKKLLRNIPWDQMYEVVGFTARML